MLSNYSKVSRQFLLNTLFCQPPHYTNPSSLRWTMGHVLFRCGCVVLGEWNLQQINVVALHNFFFASHIAIKHGVYVSFKNHVFQPFTDLYGSYLLGKYLGWALSLVSVSLLLNMRDTLHWRGCHPLFKAKIVFSIVLKKLATKVSSRSWWWPRVKVVKTYLVYSCVTAG